MLFFNDRAVYNRHIKTIMVDRYPTIIVYNNTDERRLQDRKLKGQKKSMITPVFKMNNFLHFNSIFYI